MTADRGWSPQRWQRWVATTVAQAVCPRMATWPAPWTSTCEAVGVVRVGRRGHGVRALPSITLTPDGCQRAQPRTSVMSSSATHRWRGRPGCDEGGT